MEKDSKKDTSIITFLKGVSMGLADLVPGVSGGTIALIAGIYERLILAIRSIDLKILIYLLRTPFDRNYLEKSKQSFQSIDYKFLLPLAGGIATAIIGASRLMSFLLFNYPAYINSFFFGLILISAGLVYNRINEKTLKNALSGPIGFLFAFIYAGISLTISIHTLPFIFISGSLAICAMILPGISGAFILYFLGQYDYMINALHSFPKSWPTIVAFLLGAVISLFSFSRLLSYLLKKYHAQTLFFLTGLMLGALRLPFKKVITALEAPGIIQNPLTLAGAIISGLLGAFILIIIEMKRLKR
ncbi:hypothetical protein AKJ38_00790 [candidate division MSBL1 archaeon SCGC-AAA259I14]|uniref:DUF368 domain-containing protein n=1 Tax=candidate division MSBL1 archaeon SCGC-AAA259I14 TaxID=1698268 RepID=A0A133UTZ7_9EURY|nr:hypothetical protein AKJ38_00790 [candidate division MSBL1 archaeon SCGC-AAA259I14]